jgi:hypothetical protein
MGTNYTHLRIEERSRYRMSFVMPATPRADAFKQCNLAHRPLLRHVSLESGLEFEDSGTLLECLTLVFGHTAAL